MSALNSNSKPVFRLRFRFILSYLIMLIIPFLLYIITFAIATQAIQNYIRTSHLSALSQSQSLVEEQLNQISSLALQMSSDSTLNDIYSETPTISNSTHLNFTNALSNFSNFLKSKDLIPPSSCYVYLYKIDKVMLADTIYPANVYHDFVLGFPKDNYANWQETLTSHYPAGQIIDAQYDNSHLSENSIIWAQSLPQQYLKQPKATLVVHIDKATLASFFHTTADDEGLIAYIEDSNGELVASLSDSSMVNEYRKEISLNSTSDFFSTRIKGDKLLVSHTVSEQNGWKYVSIVPETKALGQLYSFRRIAYISVAAIALLGLLAAGMLASRSSKPIIRISDKLHELLPNENSDSLREIESGVSKLVEDNQSLQKDLDNQRPYIKNNLMSCLFKGNFNSVDELTSISTYAGVDLSFTSFIAVMVRFRVRDSQSLNTNHIKEISIHKVLLHNLIEDTLQRKMLFHETDYRTTGLLLDAQGFSEDYRETLNNQLAKVQEEMSCRYNSDVFFAIGNPCSDYLNVWRSV
ncbi:MAG TPA: hypothetical protein VJX95_00575, partial [Oscillospiraceae bacterium]|nr:hypothetical protein [Oscillospiraceae bacterium]